MIRLRVLIFAEAAFLSAWLGRAATEAWGWSPEFLLLSLVAAGFFLELWEFAPLVLWGLWLSAWPVYLGPESAVFALLLFASYFAARLLPLRPWFNAVLVSAFAFACLVLASYPFFILVQTRIFMLNFGASLVLGALFYGAFRKLGYHFRGSGPVSQRLPIYLP